MEKAIVLILMILTGLAIIALPLYLFYRYARREESGEEGGEETKLTVTVNKGYPIAWIGWLAGLGLLGFLICLGFPYLSSDPKAVHEGKPAEWQLPPYWWVPVAVIAGLVIIWLLAKPSAVTAKASKPGEGLNTLLQLIFAAVGLAVLAWIVMTLLTTKFVSEENLDKAPAMNIPEDEEFIVPSRSQHQFIVLQPGQRSKRMVTGMDTFWKYGNVSPDTRVDLRIKEKWSEQRDLHTTTGEKQFVGTSEWVVFTNKSNTRFTIEIWKE